MKPADITNVCRDYFLEGWTVADIHHSLDYKADGTRWPHSGAPATKDAGRMREWMKYRLGDWRNASGEILLSKGQRSLAHRAALKRQQEATQRRMRDEKAEREARATKGYSPEKIAALAAIHSLRNS